MHYNVYLIHLSLLLFFIYGGVWGGWEAGGTGLKGFGREYLRNCVCRHVQSYINECLGIVCCD